MKKTRFLALVLVVSLMMMGAGYAFWQDDVTITNTVDTGNLDFALSTPAVTTGADYVTEEFDIDAEDADVATLNLEEMYPGATVVATINVTNTSTMATKLINTALTPAGNSDDYTTTLTATVDELAFNLAADQLEPGKTIALTYTITMKSTVENHENDGTTSFVFQPTFEQFNKQ